MVIPTARPSPHDIMPAQMTEPSRAELKYLIERQREELRTLNEVGRLLGTATDPEEIVLLVATYLTRAFPVALCAALLPGRPLRFLQVAEISQVESDAAARAIRDAAARLLAPPTPDERFSPDVQMLEGADGEWAQPVSALRSSAMLPLIFTEQPEGLLCVFSGKSGAFSEDDERVLGIVADQFAGALRHAWLLDELKRANQLKSDLLLVISHELRIPLTSIKEGVSLILDGTLGATTSEQQDFLQVVSDSTNRLAQLIENVVMATEIMTGELRLSPAEADLRDLLAKAAEPFRNRAAAKELAFELSLPAQELRHPLDARWFGRAVGILIDNALKATAAGTLGLSCAAGPDEIVVKITDTGVGIPPEELPTIFEQFRFVGGVDNRRTGGLGLGLFIANAVIAAHGGSIRIESKPGTGTTMEIRLPRAGRGHAQ